MKLKPGDRSLLTDSMTAGLVYFAVQRGFVARSADDHRVIRVALFLLPFSEMKHYTVLIQCGERLSSRANLLFPKSIICWGIESWLEPLNCCSPLPAPNSLLWSENHFFHYLFEVTKFRSVQFSGAFFDGNMNLLAPQIQHNHNHLSEFLVSVMRTRREFGDPACAGWGGGCSFSLGGVWFFEKVFSKIGFWLVLWKSGISIFQIFIWNIKLWKKGSFFFFFFQKKTKFSVFLKNQTPLKDRALETSKISHLFLCFFSF